MSKSDKTSLNALPLGAVIPEGWLKDQLLSAVEIQKKTGSAAGLLADGEWKRGESYPRFVRGLILLAGALGDKNLKDKASRYILPIFNSANEGGYFGPSETSSLTPSIEGVKALESYYALTGDKKAISVLRKFFKNQYNTLSVNPVWYDSRARLLEEISAVHTVYRETDLEWLCDLAEKLRDTSNDWFRLAAKFPYREPWHKYVSERSAKKILKTVGDYDFPDYVRNPKLKPLTPELIESEWKRKAHRILVETSAVNLAKAVKYPAVYGDFIGDGELKRLSLKLIANLLRFHGTATGMFTSASRISGTDPESGIGIEASVEMAESLVEVLQATGEFACADLLEKIVFNVLSSACLANTGAVEDVTAANLICASARRGGTAFSGRKLSEGAIALLSAYPIFMRALCMTRDNELNFMTYAPCTMEIQVHGSKIVLKEETGYPFRNTVVFNVIEAENEPEVKINFRVPGGATMQLISGGQVVASGSRSISVKCVLKAGSTFMLKQDIPLRAVENRDGSLSLMKGSVLMASKLAYKPICCENGDIELGIAKKWNFAPVVSKKSTNGFRKLYEDELTAVNSLTDLPFSFEKPPFELKIRCKNVTNWDSDADGFAAFPSSPSFSEESIERLFVPFGCTGLRISQFPKCLR